MGGDGFEALAIRFGRALCFGPGKSFDATHSGGDCTFADDAEEPDFSRAAHMGAATKLHAVAVQSSGLSANLDNPDAVAVLIAEELHDVLAAAHLSISDIAPSNGRIFEDLRIDQTFDRDHLFRREGGTAEVEGQLVRPHVAAFLHGFEADHLMQRPVE